MWSGIFPALCLSIEVSWVFGVGDYEGVSSVGGGLGNRYIITLQDYSYAMQYRYSGAKCPYGFKMFTH